MFLGGGIGGGIILDGRRGGKPKWGGWVKVYLDLEVDSIRGLEIVD